MKHPLTVQQRLDREGQGPQRGDVLLSPRGKRGVVTHNAVCRVDSEGCGSGWFYIRMDGTKANRQIWFSVWAEWAYASRADGKPCEGDG